MPTVRMPDGTVVQFPDSMPIEQIESILATRKPGDPGSANISQEDRAAYAQALPGTPEGAKAREAIAQRYGGSEAFRQEFDPLGEFIGQRVLPPVLATGLMSAIPALRLFANAPIIARTMQARHLAGGGQPMALEPGLGQIAKATLGMAKAPGQAIAGGLRTALENPTVREALKLAGFGAAAGAGARMLGGGKE